jgi:hypothetical protein
MTYVAIATISEESILELWEINVPQPVWSAHIPGESFPSSINFLDGGIVIGRRNGTFFQMLPVMSDRVYSTLRLVDSQTKDESDMFGHAAYDSRIQTLWVTNIKRESVIAVRLSFVNHPRIEQILEFMAPKPSIHFAIFTDFDLDGEVERETCLGAGINPGPLAMVAFSYHDSGVDQVIIKKDWFDNAVTNTRASLPPLQSRPVTAPVSGVSLISSADNSPLSHLVSVPIHRSPSPPSRPHNSLVSERGKEVPLAIGESHISSVHDTASTLQPQGQRTLDNGHQHGIENQSSYVYQ